MKLLNVKHVLLIFVLVLSFQSCSKFEDGPKISLRTSKQRISRDWKIEYSINIKTGIRHSADYDGWLLSFDKGGSYTKTIYYNNIESSIIGDWAISGNQLKLEETGGSIVDNQFYTITRLTKKELWMKDNLEEIHYYSD